jgi:threonine dehydrogenase-like Zn-dependent dehydrogenase
MKALVYTGPEGMAYREAPDPAAKDGEHLIRIAQVGICGSDMHAYLGHDDRRPAPLILGHEAAGVIEGGARNGDRVTINPLVSCGSCAACATGRGNLCADRQIISMPPREGAFAELVAMPEQNLVTVPDHVPLAKAALAEPIACGWHAVSKAHETVPDAETALVLGGGAIGLGAALSLAAQGITDVTVIEPGTERRRFLVEQCGQRAVRLEDLPPDALFDVVIDGVGFAATRAAASARARPGGVIVHIGLGEDTGGLDVRRMTLQEITFIGTYTYTPKDFRQTAQAIFDGRLGPLDWVETRPLADGAQAFADIRSGAVAVPKILLVPETAPEGGL